MIEVNLPIGIESDGTYYKRVIIDEHCGYDSENSTTPEVKGNVVKANTLLLRRIIQEIPGLLERKPQRYGFISEELVRNMFQADRDACLVTLLQNTSDPISKETPICPKCDSVQATETIDLRTIEFTNWSHKETNFRFELPSGYTENSVTYKVGTFRLPTGADIEEFVSAARNNINDAQTRLITRCMKLDNLTICTRETVKTMLTRDRDYLIWKLGTVTPGFKTLLNITCNTCGHKFKHGINVMDFFDSTRNLQEN